MQRSVSAFLNGIHDGTMFEQQARDHQAAPGNCRVQWRDILGILRLRIHIRTMLNQNTWLPQHAGRSRPAPAAENHLR